MSWPALLLWALLIPTALSKGPALLTMLIVVNVFMALQMLPGDGGGANLLPPTIYAVAFVVKVALAPGNLMRGLEAALDWRRLGLFTGFIVYAVLTALVLPRVFLGLIEVIPVSGGDLNGSSLLQPRSGNITQSCYMLASYLAAVAFAVIGSRPDVRESYMQALLWGALALILSGLADLAFYRAGLGSLLDPFRTAQYQMLADVEAAGVKRVVGFTSEASTYGTLCISAATPIIFLRPIYRAGLRRLAANLAVLGLLGMAALSTSATAYVGGGVLSVLYAIDVLRRAVDRHASGRDNLGRELAVLLGLAIAALACLALSSGLLAQVTELIDKILFQKAESLSYEQRSLWTRIGWQAFLDSGGLGVGLGSIRTSNWAISILGSTGIFGGALIFGLFGQKLTASARGLSPEEATFARAMKLALIPFLAMSSLGGTIPDIGIGVAAAFGFLSSARALPAKDRATEHAIYAARPAQYFGRRRTMIR